MNEHTPGNGASEPAMNDWMITTTDADAAAACQQHNSHAV